MKRLLPLIIGVWLLPVAFAVAATPAQKASLGRPAIINTTYTITDEYEGSRTFHVYEENGRLALETWNNGARSSKSVEYEKVNFVAVGVDLSVTVEGSDGSSLTLMLHNKHEAEELAEYVASKSAFHLEHIGWTWRIRWQFECPKVGGPGCRDFKKLVDDDDSEIAEYFYSQDKNDRTYACFAYKKSRFLIVQYDHFGEFGIFVYEEFENQQSGRYEAGQIRWVGGYEGGEWIGDSGRLIESSLGIKPDATPDARGTIDSASFLYQTKYPNKEDTTTQYSLSVRWATGRFTENFSGKDKKGKPWNFDWTGICVKLD